MAWPGGAGLGEAGHGRARVVSQYGTPVPLVAFGEGHERGRARQGMAGPGEAWQG